MARQVGQATVTADEGVANSRMKLDRAVVLIAIVAVASPSVADDTSEMWRTAEAYIACGRDYVKAAYVPTVEGAKSACAKELDAYGLAMRTLAINTQIAEGRSLDAAQSFAAKKEAWARNDALDSFTHSVKEWIEEK
jgi:hypothetical protein